MTVVKIESSVNSMQRLVALPLIGEFGISLHNVVMGQGEGKGSFTETIEVDGTIYLGTGEVRVLMSILERWLWDEEMKATEGRRGRPLTMGVGPQEAISND